MAAQAPMAGQPITAQMGPALQQQQFFINPQAMHPGAATAAPMPMTQFAGYNQQGQPVMYQMPLQIPANQQHGQQQILFTNVAAQQQAAQQQHLKPGQPMMAAGPPGSAAAGKPMGAMPGTAVSQNYAIAGSGTLVTTTAGGQQTLMITNPMSAVTGQPGTPVSAAGSQQVKQIQPSTPDGKGAPAHMSSATTPTQMFQVHNGAPGTPQTQQMLVNGNQLFQVHSGAPGTPQTPQMYVSNNQIFLRAPAPQDASAMFSPPTAPNQSPLAPQQPGQMQHQANPQLAAQPLQPMALARAPMSTFQPVNQPVKQGKTAISRAMPIRPSFQSSQVPGHLQPQPQQLPHTSPKGSKSKSPRVPGLIGRPPGPGKAAAALNALKSPAAVAPHRLPSSVVSSMAVVAGPPMLQTTQALLPPPVVMQAPQPQFTGMPKLQPMMPAPPTPAVVPPQCAPTAVEPKKEEAPAADPATPTDSKDEVESKETVDTPKAVVKPNVLSHVIDGHVIKESSTPFPVRDDREGPLARIRRKNDCSASSSSTTTTTTTTAASNGTQQEPERRGPGRPKGSTNNKPSDKGKNRGGEVPSKRAKMDTDSNGDLVKPPTPASTSSSTATPTPKTATPVSSIPGVPDAANILKDNPLKWSVQRVCDFVKKQPGCAEYVGDFELQEIDGQALMLLKTDHLMSAMAMKLGPALKICEAIESMREALNQH